MYKDKIKNINKHPFIVMLNNIQGTNDDKKLYIHIIKKIRRSVLKENVPFLLDMKKFESFADLTGIVSTKLARKIASRSSCYDGVTPMTHFPRYRRALLIKDSDIRKKVMIEMEEWIKNNYLSMHKDNFPSDESWISSNSSLSYEIWREIDIETAVAQRAVEIDLYKSWEILR